MTAPVLVLLARGCADCTVMDTIHGLRAGMQSMRPELSVHVAFLGSGTCPTPSQVATQLARAGVTEIVFVPLEVSRAFGAEDAATAALLKVRSEHPECNVVLADPIGPRAVLLKLLDLRLRSALRRRQVTEIDALVLSAGDPVDARSAALLQRRARQWSLHHKLPVVIATTSAGVSDVGDAIGSLANLGRRHVAVGSWFLTADADFTHQFETARRRGAITVSGPFGAESDIADLALARYVVAAMGLLEFGEPELTDAEDRRRHLRVVSA